ncbi:hypothetical protein AB1Y20_002589 [Prymnesium parvum]|uniref:Protein kinase domain-containing protein n=1 Tax=Prymnesium parvum TaxID=97485 RepID=A0AB34JBA2_PRYPA
MAAILCIEPPRRCAQPVRSREFVLAPQAASGREMWPEPPSGASRVPAELEETVELRGGAHSFLQSTSPPPRLPSDSITVHVGSAGSSWPTPAPARRVAAPSLSAQREEAYRKAFEESEAMHLARLSERRRRWAATVDEMARERAVWQLEALEADAELSEVQRRHLAQLRARRAREAQLLQQQAEEERERAAALRVANTTLRVASVSLASEVRHAEGEVQCAVEKAARAEAAMAAAEAKAKAKAEEAAAAAVEKEAAVEAMAAEAEEEERRKVLAAMEKALLESEAAEAARAERVSLVAKREEQTWTTSTALAVSSEDVRLGGAIAEGEFAEVFRGLLWGQKVAVKQLKLRESGVDDLLRELRHEVSIMAAMRHPNILTLIGSLEGERPSIVLEVMEGTLYELGSALYASHGDDKVAQLLGYLMDVLCGCAYLHGRSPAVLHRDLKPPNVLFDETKRCKLCDFGTAVLIDPATSPCTESIGSALYMAPEVEAATPYGLPADVFSFGAVAYEMLYILDTGEDFYTDMNLFNGLEIFRGPLTSEPSQLPERPKVCTDDGLWSLISECLSVQPEKRPTFANIARRLGSIRSSSDNSRADWLAKTV